MATAATETALQRGAAWLHRVLQALALLGLLACGLPAAAHPMPESRVWVDTTPSGLSLTLQLPLNRLEFAYGHPLAEHPERVLAEQGDGLALYLLQHVGARSGPSGEGAGWTALRPQLSVQGEGGDAELQAVLPLVAPEGADTRQLTLLFDAITHEVRTHRVQVFLRNDWAGGFVGSPPLPLGELHSGQSRLSLQLGQGAGPAASVLRLLKDGALHIAEGTDHLLFLLLLLIVAPLQAVAGRWGRTRDVKGALHHTAWVVTAFTLGHTLTLVLGSTGLLTLPAQPVEVAVALTIAVAALHAARPLLADGETFMAGCFGLVHGLAFSASLNGAGLTAWQHGLALLAFNLGIEAMQLALVLAVLPALLLIARQAPRGYALLRSAGAAAALIVALLWIAERLGADPWAALPGWADGGTAVFHALPVLLWAAAGGAALAARRSRPTA